MTVLIKSSLVYHLLPNFLKVENRQGSPVLLKRSPLSNAGLSQNPTSPNLPFPAYGRGSSHGTVLWTPNDTDTGAMHPVRDVPPPPNVALKP